MRRLGHWLVVGLAAIGFLTIAAAVVVVAGRRHLSTAKVAIKAGDYLTVDFDQGLSLQPPHSILEGVVRDHAYSLSDLLFALRRGARDSRVAGLVAYMGTTDLSPAVAEEMGAAVEAFRKAGKPTLLYAKSIGEAGDGLAATALASAFSQVWVQPTGMVGLSGLAVEQPFLRKGLADLGIHAEIVQRREYKGAMAFLTGDEMPAPVRENTQALIADIADGLIADIARRRGLEARDVAALADRGPLPVPEALAAKLIDRADYQDSFDAGLGALFHGRGVDARNYVVKSRRGDPAIALIHLTGQIVSGDSDFRPMGGLVLTGADVVSGAIADAVDDSRVRAILLRIDSPGGDYGASDTIRRAVDAARAKSKPVIVSMGGYAASGGYFVAAAGETVVAEPGTITGSIGVLGGKIVLADAWAKLGVHWQTLKTGETAGMWSVNRDFSPAERARIESLIDAAYDDFTAKVAKARKLSPEAMDQAARGRVFSGRQAKALGLVDELGGLSTALTLAKRAAGIPDAREPEILVFPAPKGLAQSLRELASGKDGPLLQSLSEKSQILGPLATLMRWERLGLSHGAAILPLELAR